MNGRVSSHGSRQHGDTTSPVLRDHSRRITAAMAAHYASNPNVIGWQTDNELNTTTSLSFSKSCEVEFRKWCHLKYGTIEKLNEAWGGHFWATHYDNFDQVVLPMEYECNDDVGAILPGYTWKDTMAMGDRDCEYYRARPHACAAGVPIYAFGPI